MDNETEKDDQTAARKASLSAPPGSPVRRPILIGQAEVIDMIPASIRRMLETEGLYIGSDPSDPSKGEVPLVSMGGRFYSMVIDKELDPTRSIEGHQIDGPFRANSD